MELLLNLAWVMLALPGYWLWRRGRGARRVSPLQCLLALGCALVLLFPVISATDDLHAMRAEMEDSAVSKRNIRQTGSDKASVWNNRWQSPPALVGSVPAFAPSVEGSQKLLSSTLSVPVAPAILRASRAPPCCPQAT